MASSMVVSGSQTSYMMVQGSQKECSKIQKEAASFLRPGPRNLAKAVIGEGSRLPHLIYWEECKTGVHLRATHRIKPKLL